MSRIGFMQGRFSDMVNGKIQAFPWGEWQNEFKYAQESGFDLMEWTLDFDRLNENPIMTKAGRSQILTLSKNYGIDIGSMTADCSMQAPFYKACGSFRDSLLLNFKRIIEACLEMGISYIVIPLVDNGSIENSSQEKELLVGISSVLPMIQEENLFIAFESDFDPQALRKFIDGYPSNIGINYDIGNSASSGFDPKVEFLEYGNRVVNVHIKDRILGGNTVPLGEGAANLPLVFNELKRIGYSGNYILQTARALDGNHADALIRYKKMVEGWQI